VIVFAADLHLSPTIWVDLPKLRGDSYDAFRQIVDYCLVNKVDALLLGGDIFHRSTPDSESVLVFKHEVTKLREADIPVLAIQGQHDRSEPPWFKVVSDVCWMNEGYLPLPIDGTTYTLRAFDNLDAETLSERLENLEQCDILMMHQAMQEVLSIDGAWNLREDWIPDFVQLVLLGDIHVEAKVGRCYYSGATHLRAMNENPQKSFIVVSSDGGELKVERKPITPREITTMTVGDEEGLIAALGLIEALPADALVLARVAPDVPNSYKKLSDACRERNIHLRIRDLPIAVTEDQDERGTTAMATSLDGAVASIVDREAQPELYQLLVQLLAGPDPDDVLGAIKSKMGIAS
jgi:DNA repair exonuclease SbcCD nuclease subunit